MNTIEKAQDFEGLVPYLDEFIPIVINLIHDQNFKISINGLNITGLILKAIDKSYLAPFLENILEILLGKLGDSKVAIRQISIQILIMAAKVTLNTVSYY